MRRTIATHSNVSRNPCDAPWRSIHSDWGMDLRTGSRFSGAQEHPHLRILGIQYSGTCGNRPRQAQWPDLRSTCRSHTHKYRCVACSRIHLHIFVFILLVIATGTI